MRRATFGVTLQRKSDTTGAWTDAGTMVVFVRGSGVKTATRRAIRRAKREIPGFYRSVNTTLIASN